MKSNKKQSYEEMKQILQEEELKRLKKLTCFDKIKFWPNSPFKIKWDIFIILLTIYNCFMVPLEFSFSKYFDKITALTAIDYCIDICFALDILVNFRTVYIDPKTD